MSQKGREGLSAHFAGNKNRDPGQRLERDELGLSHVSCLWKAMTGVGRGGLGQTGLSRE